MFIPDERLLKHEFQQSPIKSKYSTSYTCNIIVANRQSMSSNYIIKNTFDTTSNTQWSTPPPSSTSL